MNSILLHRLQLAFCAVGLFASGSLTFAKIFGVGLSCGMAQGCEKVANSAAAYIAGGIPVALVGMIAYVGLFGIMAIRPSVDLLMVRRLIKLGLIVSGIGTAISLYYQYVSFAQIQAACTWCIASAVSMTVIFVTYLLLQKEEWPEETSKFETPFLIGIALATSVALGAKVVELNGASSGLRSVTPPLSKEFTIDRLLADPTKYSKGDPKAPITVVEFADVFCGGCRSFFPKNEAIIFSPAMKNKVRLIYRHFPLSGKEGHENSDFAAYALEYAEEKGKYWPALEYFFNVASLDDLNSIEGILFAVKKLGLDDVDFRKRLADGDKKLLEAVEGDKQRASQAGMNETPTYFIFAKGLPTRSADGKGVETTLNMPEYKKIIDSK
ncbi:MAG: thioredoxin domain-containing protein [Armatimonadetes bacterium]|nr:thioredoxin domain-containing protein [Armatimonadota bacterium]